MLRVGKEKEEKGERELIKSEVHIADCLLCEILVLFVKNFTRRIESYL